VYQLLLLLLLYCCCSTAALLLQVLLLLLLLQLLLLLLQQLLLLLRFNRFIVQASVLSCCAPLDLHLLLSRYNGSMVTRVTRAALVLLISAVALHGSTARRSVKMLSA
jgi:hypothetical protein